MADVAALENNDVPVVEKLGAEDKETTTGKACMTVAIRPTAANAADVEPEESVANGDGPSSEGVTKEDSASTVSAVKENGDSASFAAETGAAANKTAADEESAVAATNAAASSTEDAGEEPAEVVVTAENGVNKSEANGDATDSAVHGEAVKRKIDDTVVDSKLAENVAVEVTPEKKAKIEDNAKEELKTSTTETSEVAA